MEPSSPSALGPPAGPRVTKRWRYLALPVVIAAAALALFASERPAAPAPVRRAWSLRPAADGGPESELTPPARVAFTSRGAELTGYLFEPSGSGPVPVLVYNHGSEQNPDLESLGAVGRFYQSRGLAVLLPWRQGCSGSGGRYWVDRFPLEENERGQAAEEARDIRALEDETIDVLEAVRYARSLPRADPEAILVGGSSYGGLLALMVAASTPTVKGAIVCSGAAWTYAGNTEDGQAKLFEIARSAKAPVFLMQAQNDYYNPAASTNLGRAMDEWGLPNVTKVYPRFGTTHIHGHVGFCCKGSNVWGDDVMAFVARSLDGRRE